MRLLYLHNAPVPSTAANAVQVAKMCAAFQNAGADVTLMSPMTGLRDTPFDTIASTYGLKTAFATRRSPRPNIPGRDMLFALVGMLLHRLSGKFVLYTRSAAVGFAAIRINLPVVLELHVAASSFREKATLRLGNIFRSDKFVQLVVINDRLRVEYEADFPDLSGRILVAHDGADQPEPVQPKDLGGGFKVGYVGHLYPGKGMELITEIAPQCPWVRFHVVGGTGDDVGHWKERTKNLPNLTLHGHMPHAETPAYIAAMDVVIAPYLRDVRGTGGKTPNLADGMSPLKIFEYMSHGKAIVASDLPALREVLADDVNALLRAPEDLEGWVAALTALHADAELRARLGDRARQDFQAKYTWDQRARLILDAIQINMRQAGLAN